MLRRQPVISPTSSTVFALPLKINVARFPSIKGDAEICKRSENFCSFASKTLPASRSFASAGAANARETSKPKSIIFMKLIVILLSKSWL
jgi:hypothetical protein